MSNQVLTNQILANQVLERCNSTNDIAKILAEEGSPHGTWISTRIQESGRGRLGRQWQSLEGNLFLSIIVRLNTPTLWSWIPLTTGVGIVRYLRKEFSGLNFQVKWPNDIWLGGSKLGGILCEGSLGGSNPFVIIGIGINCLHAPDGLDQKTIDLTSAIGRGPILADDIRTPLTSAILRELDQLPTIGPEIIRKSFEDWSAFPPGTEITWGTPGKNGTVIGLGPSGELLAQTKDGNQIRIFAEDAQLKTKF
jgi:BirA family biotin operon repressor/biotin-[acetyl-CoA-carboxylase] ligase